MTSPLDLAAFQAWLRRQPGYEAATAMEAQPAEGGVSNITYRVPVEGAPFGSLAVRLQREHGIFEPYDVLREGRVIAALADSPVPAPRFVAGESDANVLGVPFIVTEWIEAPHMGLAGPEADFGAFIEAVATIHALDGRDPDLSFLGRPATAGDAIAAELADIRARAEQFAPGDAVIGAALQALEARVPNDGTVTLCHGDINVFNYLFRNSEVVGVVDWERARLGDYRSDVGHLVALSHLKGAPWCPADEAPFVLGYGAVIGRPVTGMAFFRARWLLDLAVIARTAAGLGHEDLWFSWEEATSLLATGLAEIA